MFWTINYFGNAWDEAPAWSVEDSGVCEECGSLWKRPALNGHGLCKICLSLLDGLNEEQLAFWGNGASEDEHS